MVLHLLRDLDAIKKEILLLGGMVENALLQATQALVERKADLADLIAARDDEIDAREVHIEEECLKALALHQPVAQDLRFLIMVIKVNSDLERMGDLATNMAARAGFLARQEPIPGNPLFGHMVRCVRQMLRDTLDALVRVDTELALKVRRSDDEVDGLLRQMFDHLQELMRERPETIERAIHTLSFCRNLERVADLCTNIAEDIQFMAQGAIVRHRRDLATGTPGNA
jgi:phosphate transport system protein